MPAGSQTSEGELDTWIAQVRGRLSAAVAGSDDENVLLESLAAALVERYEMASDPAGQGDAADLDEAIRCTDRVLARYPFRHGSRNYALLIAAAARYHRVFAREDPADLDNAVAYLYEIAGSRFSDTNGDAAVPLDVLTLLGQALLVRYQAAEDGAPGRADDLSEAIRLHALVSGRLAEDDSAKPAWVADLGQLYHDRYLIASAEPDAAGPADLPARDLARSIECYRWLRDSADADATIVAEGSARLGLALADRVLRWTNEEADVTEAIAALTTARRLLTAADDRLPVISVYLGVMFGVRYTMHCGPDADRDDGIAVLRATLAGPEHAPGPGHEASLGHGAALDHVARPEDVGSQEQAPGPEHAAGVETSDLARVWLGQLLIFRPVPGNAPRGTAAFGMNLAEVARLSGVMLTEGAVADAAEAVGHLSRVSSLHGCGSGDAAVAALLGCALLIRGAAGLPTEDLDRVNDCFATATRDLSPDEGGVRELIAMHAWVLAERTLRPGRAADIPEAADRLARAAGLLPHGHFMRPIILRYLGTMLGLRGMQRSHAPDLATGITALTEALQEMPAGHAMRAETLGLLGAALISAAQFDLPGLPVGKVIEMLTEALAIPQPDPAKRAKSLLAYGCALHIRAVRDGSRDDFAAAVDAVKEAAGLVPNDDGLYPSLLFTLASMLADQYSFQGNLEALDAAAYYLDELIPAVERAAGPAYSIERVDLTSARAIRGAVQLDLGMRHEDAGALDRAIADLQFALGNLPPQSPWRSRLTTQLSQARLARAGLSRDLTGVVAAFPAFIQAAESVPAGHPDRAMAVGRAGTLCVAQAMLIRDFALLDRGVGLLEDAVADTGLSQDHRARLLWGLGFALTARYGVARRRADLDRGIEWLEEARDVFAGIAGDPATKQVLAALAEAYHKRGDRRLGDPRRAIDTGIAALREQAADVLLQSGTQRGLVTARIYAADATEVACWCLDAGDAAAAVAALELGRGLVWHAATVATSVPAALSAIGRGELAAAWEAAYAGECEPVPQAPWDTGQPWTAEQSPAGDRATRAQRALLGELPGPATPSDLRRRVLTALAGSAPYRRLLSPPSRREIAGAMRATRTDAVVYLLPAGEQTEGRALVLSAERATVISLPRLKVGPHGRVAAYARAHDDLIRAGGYRDGDPAARRPWQSWNRALGDLCDWAWDAAMGTVLGAIDRPAGRPPRVTLIPFGQLGIVPWHAARTSASGKPGYACERAVFSYAASARQLVLVAGRHLRRPQASPVLVEDPVDRDVWMHREATSIRDAFYRGCAYLGARPPGQATADRVLSFLPGTQSSGASLLHVACHAETRRSPAESCLRLSKDRPLTVDRVLRRAQFRRPDLPGGLVVLSACVSDLSMTDYDEALTLATAFAAAGAASVVGTRWPVPGKRTAILMFMFHHYLSLGRSPAEALCQAQLWMIDPARVIPAEMPALLADEVPRTELPDLAAWAGFTHMGR